MRILLLIIAIFLLLFAACMWVLVFFIHDYYRPHVVTVHFKYAVGSTVLFLIVCYIIHRTI